QSLALATKYWAQVPSRLPLRSAQATLLPTRYFEYNPPPLATTVPAPSQPGTVGSVFSVPYMPCSRSKSDGLQGAASMRTRTWPERGVGVGFSTTRSPRMAAVRSARYSSRTRARIFGGIFSAIRTHDCIELECLR